MTDITEADREAAIEAITSYFSEAELVVCTRAWEAWGYGTMTEDDFETPSEENATELLETLRAIGWGPTPKPAVSREVLSAVLLEAAQSRYGDALFEERGAVRLDDSLLASGILDQSAWDGMLPSTREALDALTIRRGDDQ